MPEGLQDDSASDITIDHSRAEVRETIMDLCKFGGVPGINGAMAGTFIKAT
jgi:hypothetical protein